jgi:hypothetical protein
VGVGVGVGSTGLKTGFSSGFAAAFTDTPLFHTNLLPDLTQVYFFSPVVAVAPAFVHFAPAFGAAEAIGEIIPRTRPIETSNRSFLRMRKG